MTFSFAQDSIFRNTNFLKLWNAQLLSSIAINLLYFALTIVVYKQTESSQSVSYVVISYGLAALLFGAIAGVLVDYFSKKRILLASNLLRFGLVCLMIFFTGNYWISILFIFVLNAITQFFFPAEGATIPMIVRDKNLLSANSLFTLTMYLSQMMGFLVGGLLLNAFGFNITMYIIAGLLLVATISVAFLKIPSSFKDGEKKVDTMRVRNKVAREFKNGLTYIKDTPKVQEPLMYIAFTMIIVGLFFTLVPAYSVTVLGITPEETSLYLVTPVAIGMVLGSIIVGRLGRRFNYDKIISIGVIGGAIGFLLVAINQRIPFEQIKKATNHLNGVQEHLPDNINRILGVDVLFFAMVFMFVIGLSNAFVAVINNTKLQRYSDQKMRGRIYGILQTLVMAAALVPVMLGGIAADHLGVNKTFGIIAVLILIAHVLIRKKYGKSVF